MFNVPIITNTWNLKYSPTDGLFRKRNIHIFTIVFPEWSNTWSMSKSEGMNYITGLYTIHFTINVHYTLI